VLATLLTSHAGTGDEPLIIVGVVVAYLTTVMLSVDRPKTGETVSSPDATGIASPGAG
jgi:hypothetical protein